MHLFHRALAYIDKLVYVPNGLMINAVQEEGQNSDYGAGRFTLSAPSSLDIKTIRFRVAKQTPTKVGQFVTFWEKDASNINQPYHFDKAPDLLVITAFSNENGFGQFVFPKDILVKKGILQTNSTKGKMAMRVYPNWDKPTNKTAVKTQLWQLEYFFAVNDFQVNSFKVNNTAVLPIQKILELYSQ